MVQVYSNIPPQLDQIDITKQIHTPPISHNLSNQHITEASLLLFKYFLFCLMWQGETPIENKALSR